MMHTTPKTSGHLISTTPQPNPTPAGHSVTRLGYDVAAWSSHSANYHPRHVLVNRPSDQSSRWSSGSNNQLQYITLKLDRICVVQTITFGKYHKVHVCNLKEFKVFGGLSPNNMTELLHAGLRNDSEAETFSLKHKVNDVVFPCQYIKIAPHLAWGPNFNFSIWFVELKGISQPEHVDKIYWDYVNYRENEVIRLCMKHFRQRNYLDAFECLQKRTQLQLEDPLLTQLHDSLVMNGDFSVAEDIVQQAYTRDLYTEYVRECSYKPEWRRIKHEVTETPCMRGGHQMCMDSDAGLIYLFGGWDGQKDLNDFWSYNVVSKQWTCISLDTRRMDGPGPRSCHKICFDTGTRSIYTMGRYVDPENRPNVNLDNDFWRYDIETARWSRISFNTQAEGGPELIYDHQMVVDPESETLFVFGGRTISPDANQTLYSGLYAYSQKNNTWRLLRTDTSQPENSIQLKSRIGHSMLLNSKTRELYIFAGQRNKDYLSDFYTYDIATDTVHEVSRDYSKQGGPDAGFTQRATMDTDFGEFYILSGLQKDKNSTQESVKNSFWSYSLRRAKWTRVYHNENTGADYWSRMKDLEPCPRFAHQLVYDHVRKCHYLFGGNPGDTSNLNLRLDDFWELHLIRPTSEDVLRRAKFRIRRQQFREICQSGNTSQALDYLRSEVSAVVNHSDETESAEFRDLTQHLFNWKKVPAKNAAAIQASSVALSSSGLASGGMVAMDEMRTLSNEGSNPFQSRTELYELLLEYFPTSMREPKGNIVDLIDMAPFNETGHSDTTRPSEGTDAFDTIDWMNDVAADHKRRRALENLSPLESAFESMQSWLLVSAVGIAVGLVAAFIDIVAAWLTDVRLGHCIGEWYLPKGICCTGYPAEECPKWIDWSNTFYGPDAFVINYLFYIVFSTLFAAATAVMVVTIAPKAAGSGSAEVKTILGGFIIRDFLDFPTLLVKAIGLPLTVASGLAVGKEGPMIHVASCLGAILPDFFPKYRFNEGRKREILSAAAGCGVAVAFGAPIGGVLFSLEELSSFFPAKTMLRSYFCALVGCVTLQLVDPYRGKRVLIEVTYTRNWHFFETGAFLILGVFGGLSGAFVIKMAGFVGRLRKRSWVRLFPVREVVVIASMTALIGYLNPFTRIDSSELLEVLFKECEEFDFNGMCKLNNRGWTILLLVLALATKLGLTIVSLGLKVPAGIFIPSMVWGALFGRLVGIWMQSFQQAWPDLPMFSVCRPDTPCVTPGMYALLGAFGALGGVTRLTLALTVIMFELTGTLTYIVPCMIVLMVTKLVGDAFGKGGMTDAAIHANNLPFLEVAEDEHTGGRPVLQAMTPFSELTVLKSTLMTVEEAEQVLAENCAGFKGYPVVRSARGREFLGFVQAVDVWQAIQDAQHNFGGAVEESGRAGESFTGLRHVSDVMVDLAPYMNRTPLTVHPKMHLEAVLDMFKKLGPRYIVVLFNGRLEGIVTKKDMLRAVHEGKEEDLEDSRSLLQDTQSLLGDTFALLPRRGRLFQRNG
ncbi:Muskelin 1, intracellular mediator containing kelch motif [Chytriomyces hyalinus]|nr:Muskelin 1, intracellular mediator containing kelch motif [Chytriomyces hyalinus]